MKNKLKKLLEDFETSRDETNTPDDMVFIKHNSNSKISMNPILIAILTIFSLGFIIFIEYFIYASTETWIQIGCGIANILVISILLIAWLKNLYYLGFKNMLKEDRVGMTIGCISLLLTLVFITVTWNIFSTRNDAAVATLSTDKK